MTEYFEHAGRRIRMDAEFVNLSYRTGLTSVPNFPEAERVYLYGCTGLIEVPNFPRAARVDLTGCTSLTSVPNFPRARFVYLEGCTGLGEPLYCDWRGYELRPYHGGYVAGCRLFRTPEEAIDHWTDPEHEFPEIAAEYVRAIKQHMEEAA